MPHLNQNCSFLAHTLLRWLGVCMVILLVHTPQLSLAASPNQSASNQSNISNLNRIKQKIRALAESLSLSKNAHDSATEDLKAAEIKISASRKKLRDLQQAQRKNKQTLSQLSQNLRSAQQTVDFQRRKISEQLRAQYMQGRADHLQLLLQQQDPNRIARDMQYLGYITQARRNQINKLQESLSEIERIKIANTEALNKTNALAEEYALATQQLEQERVEKARIVTQLSKKIESQQQQLQRLKRDEQNLAKLMKRLNEQSAKRQQAQIARAKQAKKHKSKQNKSPTSPQQSVPENTITDIAESEPSATTKRPIATNEATPEYAEFDTHFRNLRGLLRLPVRGSVTNRFGTARADTGVTWKGIFIRANEGNEVKAVAKGRVVFADWMRGFGNLLIIDHGHGYMSLYGNNESLFKNTGQRVNAGDTIASVGNSGGNQESGVYYELRRNSTPFDPLSWSRLR